jgi:hypothetical protein
MGRLGALGFGTASFISYFKDIHMLFNSNPPPFHTVVTYMKSSQSRQFDRDLVIANMALNQFNKPFSLVIDPENGSNKLVKLLGEAVMGNVQILIIPDFSHLGFCIADWSSALGDLFSLSKTNVLGDFIEVHRVISPECTSGASAT